MAKCSECGFLASRNKETKILGETEPTTRYNGLASKGYEAPICLVRAYDLWDECGIRDGVIPFGNPIVSEICKRERDCKQSVKWQQGFTPKEHQEMIDRQWQLDYESRRDIEDKKWRESQEEKHSKEEWNRYKFMAFITIVAVILGVILGYFIK